MVIGRFFEALLGPYPYAPSLKPHIANSAVRSRRTPTASIEAVVVHLLYLLEYHPNRLELLSLCLRHSMRRFTESLDVPTECVNGEVESILVSENISRRPCRNFDGREHSW